MAKRPRGEQVWDVSGRRDQPAPRSYLHSSAAQYRRVWERVSGPQCTAPTCSPGQRVPAARVKSRREVIAGTRVNDASEAERARLAEPADDGHRQPARPGARPRLARARRSPSAWSTPPLSPYRMRSADATYIRTGAFRPIMPEQVKYTDDRSANREVMMLSHCVEEDHDDGGAAAMLAAAMVVVVAEPVVAESPELRVGISTTGNVSASVTLAGPSPAASQSSIGVAAGSDSNT